MIREYPSGFLPVHKTKPICGVLAVAVCAVVSFEEAHAACKRNLPSHRKRFGGRTFDEQRIRAMFDLKVKFVVWKHTPTCTVDEFVLQYAEAGKTYQLKVSRHVITVCNGWVMDQYAHCGSAGHPTRNRRVQQVIEVLK